MFTKFSWDLTPRYKRGEYVSNPQDSVITKENKVLEETKKLDVFQSIMFADLAAILGTILLTSNLLLGSIILGPALIALSGIGIAGMSTETPQ